MPILKLKNEHFFETWSPAMAYVLGFFAADGSMRVTKRGTAYVEFTSCDKELLSKIKKYMQLEHALSHRQRNILWKPSYRIQVGSKVMFKHLTKLSQTPRKSLTMNMPKVPFDYFPHFVRGYFDGDGCVSLTKHWRKDKGYYYWSFTSRFTSGSKQFLQSLKTTLEPIMQGGFIYAKQGRGYELVFSRQDSVALFGFMYNNVPTDMYLKRKYITFQKAIKLLHLGM